MLLLLVVPYICIGIIIGTYSFFHTPAFAENMLNREHRMKYPPNIDLQNYSAAVVWCERFGEFISAGQFRN